MRVDCVQPACRMAPNSPCLCDKFAAGTSWSPAIELLRVKSDVSESEFTGRPLRAIADFRKTIDRESKEMKGVLVDLGLAKP